MSGLNEHERRAAGLLTLGIHVQKSSASLPQTATQNLFTVAGGRVLVTLLFGEVTTIIQSSDPVAKITSTPTVGTAVDVGATVDITSLEVGGFIVVEGDGTAMIKGNAGAGMPGTGQGKWICATGIINLITGASKTGATKWDLWYFPLDVGATVVSA
jgi:hypothetical protein